MMNSIPLSIVAPVEEEKVTKPQMVDIYNVIQMLTFVNRPIGIEDGFLIGEMGYVFYRTVSRDVAKRLNIPYDEDFKSLYQRTMRLIEYGVYPKLIDVREYRIRVEKTMMLCLTQQIISLIAGDRDWETHGSLIK